MMMMMMMMMMIGEVKKGVEINSSHQFSNCVTKQSKRMLFGRNPDTFIFCDFLFGQLSFVKGS